ncbi:MAG: NADH-quinone oxidoreductase subunit J [Candidatus Omnitrophica bacterium CG11_big_fil_rev_8_21_14_0_20_45_26]|uniref:NADH-quinone oxidoreductase subunit J n=1 Tax=Candidatus Abzuiibacterium crystallinum TaxID=1974748 RepID=A0A2H0LMD5_9BACT|nr:MAG: NADH-quinone oxidoreductase subunit J [Candidatus Omnitrophica bacterium CG11_big_fil_rev_8_21_14_0_20_45_26]PIW63701.1 MAG: NADH-quinone oxidoreductase subunit J [Candidatus Omnitrophica bacterium CG12_big_fil_rev_8_21_14_0_65_45_16]
MPETILFYLFASVALISALYVIFSKEPTYAVLSLVVTMFSLAALYVMLHAYFIAMIQILIYAGAILVLFLFILMLLGTEGILPSDQARLGRGWCFFGVLLVSIFTAELAMVFQSTQNLKDWPSEILGTVENIGRSIFSEHLLAFELISLILLIGIIGVVNLAHKKEADNA